jgi:hypothetical protein
MGHIMSKGRDGYIWKTVIMCADSNVLFEGSVSTAKQSPNFALSTFGRRQTSLNNREK